MKKFTDKEFWQKYWDSKTPSYVRESYPFHDLFQDLLTLKTGYSMIEIGGFPGYFAIYFAKYLGFKSSLLDYYIDPKFLSRTLALNNLKKSDITVIKHDFFTYDSRTTYDLVFSLGFLEHFEDTVLVLKSHYKLVKRGGDMLIVIPNFLGLNGHLQLAWDPANLGRHNLLTMDLAYLKTCLKQSGIKSGKVFYWGGMRVWLENLRERSLFQKFIVASIYALGLLVKKMGLNNKLISPYIVIYAKKT